MFIGRTDAEDEASILWSPDGKSQLIGKDTDAGRRGWQTMRRQDGITDSVHMNLIKFQRVVKDREASILLSVGSQRVRHDLVSEQQQIAQSQAE